MKYQVELICSCKYKDKDGGMSSMISYRFLNPEFLQNTEKFKGFADLQYFCKGSTKLFDSLKKEHFGVQAELTIEERPSANNPLRKTTVLKSIKVGNELINLL